MNTIKVNWYSSDEVDITILCGGKSAGSITLPCSEYEDFMNALRGIGWGEDLLQAKERVRKTGSAEDPEIMDMLLNAKGTH